MSSLQWKPNWEETKHHLLEWWNHQGLAIGSWGRPDADRPHETVAAPPSPGDEPRIWYEDTEWRARSSYASLARGHFGADTMPVADSDIGPGSLALALGCEPGFSRETVWFDPAFAEAPDVNALPPLRFNPDAYWWQVHERQIRRNREMGRGRYLAGLWPLAIALLILYSLWFMLATTSLWFVKIHNVTNLLSGLLEAGRFPVPAYPALYRVVLTFVVPVALLTTVPASAVLHRPWGVPRLAALLLAASLAVLSRTFWRFGLRRYSSASS